VAPIVLLAAIVAAASPSPSPSPAASPLPSIGTTTVVTGSAQSLHRAAQPTSVIGSGVLRAVTAPSLDAALRTLPGVDRDRSNAPFTNYGQLRLSFQGAGTDRGTLFVDGVPAQNGFGGEVDWNAFPIGSIARTELLRGPGSALYGSGAIGGVMWLTTTPPSAQTVGTLWASGGGIDKGSATYAGTAAIGAIDTALALSSVRLGYNVIPPGQSSRADEPATSVANAANLRMRHATARTSIELNAIAANDNQSDGRPNDGYARRFRQVAATWTDGARNLFSLTGFANQTFTTVLADLYPQNPGALRYTQQVPTSQTGVRARYDVPLGSGALAFVAEQRLVTGESNQTGPTGAVQSDVAGTQQLTGLAVQGTWGGKLGGVAGARYDSIITNALGTHDARALSPRVGLRYELSPVTVLRAAYGTGLRAPYLNELVRSFRVGSILELNNPNLVPERSNSTQVGIDVGTASSHFALDYTGTNVHNAIGFATIAANTQIRSNFGATETNAYTAEYERGNACARMRAFGAVQHDRVVLGSRPQIGKRLAYVPDAYAGLDVERTVRNVTGALELSYSGPTFADDLQTQPLGTALLVGARLTFRSASGAALSLGLNNIADQVYLTSVDRLGPPSSLTLRLSVPVGAKVATPAAVCG
jgi:outer membrane cobalamin receptor